MNLVWSNVSCGKETQSALYLALLGKVVTKTTPVCHQQSLVSVDTINCNKVQLTDIILFAAMKRWNWNDVSQHTIEIATWLILPVAYACLKD